MKKFIFYTFIYLFCLQVYADSHRQHISIYSGIRPDFLIMSFGYGLSLYKEGVYIGLIESMGTINANLFNSFDLAYLSLGYGYEFFRDHRFSFGLSVFGEGGTAKSVKGEGYQSSLHISLGAFARFKMTPKWSFILRGEKPIGANQATLSNLFSSGLGLRYSF